MCTPSAGYQGALPTVLGGEDKLPHCFGSHSKTGRIPHACWLLVSIDFYLFLCLVIFSFWFGGNLLMKLALWLGMPIYLLSWLFYRFFCFFFPHTGDLYVAGFLNLCFHVYEYGVVFFKTPKSVKINWALNAPCIHTHTHTHTHTDTHTHTFTLY